MPMTIADWNAWSPEKQKFHAELFACYLIADDGMLRIDGVKRRELVRLQLAKQAVAGAEQIITRSSSANYVMADGIQPDGRTLRSAFEADRIRVLCSQRGDLKTMQSLYPVPGEGQPEEAALEILAKADAAAANREPIQHSIVGGFKRPEQTISDHFADVVKVKMLGGRDASAATRSAQLLSLGEINDLTFFSRCSLDPVEKLFLLEDPMFRAAIKKEATRLASQIMRDAKLADRIEQGILAHMDLCSEQKSNQKSLAALSIPRVETYLALFTVDQYNRIASVATENLSVAGALGFKGQSKPLVRYIVDGLLEFTFPPEFRNLLKAFFLLKGPFAGKSAESIKGHTADFIAQGELVPALTAMLREISKEQIDTIKAGSLPVPPADMGIMWDLRREPSKILAILRSMQCLDLYIIAEMAGFAREDAHHAFGLESRRLIDAVNKDIHKLWDDEAPALLKGVATALRRQEAELSEEWRGAGATLERLKTDAQPSGIRLGMMVPPKLVVVPAAIVLKEVGLFAPAPAVPVPQVARSRADLAKEAAEARLAAKAADAAAKKRDALLAAAAPADEAEDDDERERMCRA